jgi:hypothetical protein
MQRDGAQLKTPAQLILESAHVLVDHENRLQVIEEAVKRIEARSEEARNVIARLPAAPHPAPEMTYRALTNQLVRTTCVERNIEFSDGWNWLYTEFYYRERIDLKQRHAHAVKSGLIPARTRILEYAQMLEDKKEIMNCTGRLYSVARAIFIEKDFRVVRNG